MRAFLFLLCLLGVAVAKDPPKTILESLPAELAGCLREEHHAYDSPELGGSVGYNKPGLIVTVYAYDLRRNEIADGTEGKIVQEAFASANDELFDAQRAAIYSKVERQKEGMKKQPSDALISRYVV